MLEVAKYRLLYYGEVNGHLVSNVVPLRTKKEVKRYIKTLNPNFKWSLYKTFKIEKGLT